jgi:hypothetical protein
MGTRLAFLVTIVLQFTVAAQPAREITSQASIYGGQLVPCFYQGYLMFLDEAHRNLIRLYAPEGELLFDKYLPEPAADWAHGFAVDGETIAVSWTGRDHRGARRAGIALLDRTGRQIGSIDTRYYFAQHLAFGEDHALWAFGWERDSADPKKPLRDYMSVRKYVNGRESGAYMARSLFPHGLEPACLTAQEPGISLARDRIGILVCSGMTSGNPEWVELDFNGQVTGRWRLTGSHKRIAYTRDGHLYAYDWNSKAPRMFLLDRASSVLAPIPKPAEVVTLYGAQGDELVFLASWKPGPMRFLWFKQP